MGQRVLRIEALPEAALDAVAAFHAEWLPQIRRPFDPPPEGEGDHPKDGGGASPSAGGDTPPSGASRLPPPLAGEDLVLVFPPAPYDHGGWRLAAVQDLARAAAPRRVNGAVGDDEKAIAEALEWLAGAPGITGQLLAVGRD